MVLRDLIPKLTKVNVCVTKISASRETVTGHVHHVSMKVGSCTKMAAARVRIIVKLKESVVHTVDGVHMVASQGGRGLIAIKHAL